MTKGWAFLGSGLRPSTDIDMGFPVLYPHNPLKILLSGSSDGDEGFGDIGLLSRLAKSCPPLMPESLRLPEACSCL